MNESGNSPQYVDISLEDIVAGRCHIEWPLEAKLNLCHWAGAPWADRAPHAHLHGLQVEVLAHRERELIVHGASRLGKSVLGGCEGIIALHTFGARVGVFAHRWDHVSHEFQYIHKGMRDLYKGCPAALPRNHYRNSGNNQHYEVETAWNSRAKGFSTGADEGGAALGQEFSHIILGEGSKISAFIRERMLQRAIDGALMNQAYPREDIGRFFIFTTPSGFEGCAAYRVDQIQREFMNDITACEYGKVPWVTSCWIREADISENPAYDLRAMEAARKNLSAGAFEEQYLGKMVFKTGRVYEQFREDLMVASIPGPEEIARMRLALGVDTGAYFACLLMGLDRDGTLWVLDEVYTQKKDIDDSCAQIRSKFTRLFDHLFGIDDWETIARRIKYLYVDPASQHKRELNKRLNMVVRHPGRHDGAFDLLPTIDQMRYQMGQNQFRISKGATWTIDQMRKYVWKETKVAGAKEKVVREPRKDNDHCMDAMRFGGVPLIEMGPTVDAPPPLTLKDAQAAALRDRGWGEMVRQMEAPQRLNREVP